MYKLMKCILSGVLLGFLAACDASLPEKNCEPTPYDEIGPFYRPGAPVRARVGSGYILRGRVLSTKGCQPLANSRLEFWLVNPQGEYDDAHRATVYADRRGYYDFECNRPTDYVGREPHIHIMVQAKGHEQLITQHYPNPGESEAKFDLILEPVQEEMKQQPSPLGNERSLVVEDRK